MFLQLVVSHDMPTLHKLDKNYKIAIVLDMDIGTNMKFKENKSNKLVQTHDRMLQ